jgi:hypothetical protein
MKTTPTTNAIATLSEAPAPGNVKTMALNRAMALLRAAGATFAIIDADGTKHGELELAPPPKVSLRTQVVPRGSMMAVYKAPLDALPVGEMTVIPYGAFDNDRDRESLRGSVASYCTRLWGKQTYMTHCNSVGIEVLRAE